MNYDVIVVGGGPAGLSAAFSAAKAGVKVAVLEKSKEIGYPIHTSGGSWIDELTKLDIPERFMHPIYEGLFVSQNAEALFKYDLPPSCVLDVRGLYQYLAELAASEGAEIFVSTTVTAASLELNRITGVQTRRLGRELFFKGPLVVDASGVRGILARQLGLSTGFERVGIGAEYDLYAPDWPSKRVAFFFGHQLAPSGYGWVFPYADCRVKVGVGIIRPDSLRDPKELLENVLSQRRLFEGGFSRVSQIEYHTGLIPSEINLKRTVSDGLLVVGDAGGLMSTLLGEGIRFAIDIGRMAGQVAAEAVQEQRCDRRYLSRFQDRWQRKYGRTFKMGHYVNRRLAKYTDDQWDRGIRALSKMDPQTVPALLRGEFTFRNLSGIIGSNHKLVGQLLALFQA